MQSNPNVYEIILADDHAVLRASLKLLIDSISGQAVIGEAGDGTELLELLLYQPCDMVILDLGMPNMNGLETLKHLSNKYPKIAVIILTTHREYSFLKRALARGAIGYILKEDVFDLLLLAIRDGREGKRVISQDLLGLLDDDHSHNLSDSIETQPR